MTPPPENIAERASRIRWFHTLELPGVTTPGAIDSRRLLSRLDLPESLTGKSVLDIGAWDGFWSFEAARRGATDVLATDSYSWGDGGWGTKEGFELAREALSLSEVVRDQHIDVMDLSPEALGGRFDVVLLLGVLYHLRDPITALERAASCSSGTIILETETALNWVPVSAARLYPGAELANDPTNWYQYNARALTGLLREFGFPHQRVVYKTPLHRRIGRALLGDRQGQSRRMAMRSRRIIIHAHR